MSEDTGSCSSEVDTCSADIIKVGLALAEKLISNGSHVVAVGRRQGNLDQLQQKHGKEKVSIYQFDVNELDKIPKFVDEYAHPNLRRV